jgi:hypothetical protein
MHACTYTQSTHSCTHIHTCMQCTHTYMNTYTCMQCTVWHTHKYMYSHTHTYTHTILRVCPASHSCVSTPLHGSDRCTDLNVARICLKFVGNILRVTELHGLLDFYVRGCMCALYSTVRVRTFSDRFALNVLETFYRLREVAWVTSFTYTRASSYLLCTCAGACLHLYIFYWFALNLVETLINLSSPQRAWTSKLNTH